MDNGERRGGHILFGKSVRFILIFCFPRKMRGITPTEFEREKASDCKGHMN